MGGIGESRTYRGVGAAREQAQVELMDAATTAGRLGQRLVLRGVSKRFGATWALDSFDLAIAPGEIHGLVGRNGSGKSTLIKILAGYHGADSVDRACLDDEALHLKSPGVTGGQRRIGFVHQDLALNPEISVLENMRVGQWRRTAMGTVSWRRERAQVRSDLAAVGLHVDPDRPIRSLEMGQRALIAVARALGRVRQMSGPGLLVLDEPTAALTAADAQIVFGALRRIAANGTSVLFVSHRLAEVFEITDRITVIRDGRAITVVETGGSAQDDVVEAILGWRLTDFYPERGENGEEVVLRVDDIEVENLASVSFTVRSGEIVGLTGLAGTGHEALPYAMTGVTAARRGSVTVGDRVFACEEPGPGPRIEAGLVLIPGDRQRFGLVPAFSIRENVSLPVLRRLTAGGLIHRRAENKIARDVIERYGVVPKNAEAPVRELSGGNQQKVLIGKWLQREPQVVVMHEPTQGVDVGAKRDIFGEIEGVANRGAGVVISSNEYEDLAHLCHRVLVFGSGRMAREISGKFSGDAIAAECFRASLEHQEPGGQGEERIGGG